ncbi:MAG: nucleotidyltransferase [Armatimonadetes bacterium]|nr:nucleotidyltransferase [Armatimonadota bacterium]
MAQTEECIGTEHQVIYIQALESLAKSNVPFVLGGAFAVWHYTGAWRHTHDIDVFTSPEHVPAAVEALTQAGFADLGEQAQGDREWIYHAIKGEIIVDVIWKFANRITAVDQSWMERAQEGEVLGVKVKIIPIEELVWTKIFVMNRHRCDWPDVIRILRANCPTFDWNKLLNLLGEHWLLFAGVVDVFDWECPAASNCIPDYVRSELRKRREEYRPDPSIPSREKLLDPWIHARPEDLCYWAP